MIQRNGVQGSDPVLTLEMALFDSYLAITQCVE